MKPIVSVLSSVYNGEVFIRQSVESILNQNFTELEFIVVDDGSTDKTFEIIAQYGKNDKRVKLIRNEKNIGLTKSLNRGLNQCTGDFIARQDADDISLKDRLETQLHFLNRKSDVGLLGTAYYAIDANGNQMTIHRLPENDTLIRWQLLFHNAFCHTSVMFRRNLLINNSYCYDENMRYSQDYELWSRLAQHTKMANLNVPLVKFRKHSACISNTLFEQQQWYATKVSLREMNRILPELTIDDAAKLREIYYDFPKQIKNEDVQLIEALLKLINKFYNQGEINQRDFNYEKHKWVYKILASVNGPLAPEKKLKLFKRLLKQEFKSVIKFAIKSIVKH